MRKANISTLCAKFFSCASARRALALAEHSCVVGETQAGRPSEDCSAQCVHTESQAYMMKIPKAYHEAPTTKFGSF